MSSTIILSRPEGPNDDLTTLAIACVARTFWSRMSWPLILFPPRTASVSCGLALNSSQAYTEFLRHVTAQRFRPCCRDVAATAVFRHRQRVCPKSLGRDAPACRCLVPGPPTAKKTGVQVARLPSTFGHNTTRDFCDCVYSPTSCSLGTCRALLLLALPAHDLNCLTLQLQVNMPL